MSIHSDKSQPLVLVQALRAVAALLVLIGHVQGHVVGTAAASGVALRPVPFIAGGFGVDLFFAISGFIMVVSSSRLFDAPGARSTFLLRRAFRLIPLYWFATLAYVALVLVGSHAVPRDFALAAAASLAFFPYASDGADVFPVFTLGWSLNYEVFFYLLFSMFIVWPLRRAVLGVTAALLAVAAVGAVMHPETVALRFWSQPIILEFGFGVVFGFLWLRGWRIGAALATMLALCALAALVIDPLGLSIKVNGASTPNDWVRVIGWGLPAATMLAGAVFFERGRIIDHPALAFPVALGDCSYSLYLMHPFALLFIGKTWTGLHLERWLPWPVLALALIAGSVALAWLSYRTIEKPVTRWLHRRAAARPHAPMPA